MNRRLALLTLFFALAVILLAVSAVNAVDKNNRRQALQASCRLLASLADEGVEQDELAHLAAQEGYTLAIRDATQASRLPARADFCAVPLADGERELALFAAGESLLFSPQGSPIRWMIAGVSIAVLVFTMLISRSILKPVQELTTASMEITAGHYDRRVRVRSRDELGSLEYQFNSMAARLQETIEQLNHRSAEMESIVNAMRNGLIAVDEQMHVIRLNPVARAMFEVHGNPYGMYVLDATRNAKLESHLAAAMEQGEMYTADLPVRIEKENRLLRLYITGLVHENQSIGALALIEDITELRRLENVRVDFVANVTHELKTPLTSIRGFVETLQQGAIDDRDSAMRFLSIISMEAERLTRLIDDVLSLSSLESGKKRDANEPIPFAPYVRQMCELLQSTAKEKNIQLHLEDQSRGVSVVASEDKLKQILINLIDNAIKYTPDDGHVAVSVDVEDEKLVLRVKDDGIGIEQESIPRLFERFYRVDKGRSRSMGGTGLGLAIVKHIVIELGGRIDVSSTYGEGSVFTVVLPLAQEKNEAK